MLSSGTSLHGRGQGPPLEQAIYTTSYFRPIRCRLGSRPRAVRPTMARSTVTDQPATRAEEGAKPFGASKHTLRELGQLKPKQVRADKWYYIPDLHGAVCEGASMSYVRQ